MKEYHAINLLVGLVVVLMLLSVKFDWITVHCIYADIGKTCRTCGLTRAFSAVLNGNFGNIPTSFWVLFVLLAGQLIFRPLVSTLLITTKRFTIIRNLDITVTVGLFIMFLMLL